MINRELIRIKIVQLVFAYYVNGDKTMDVAERELLTSLSKAYHLYNHLLDLIVAITNEERLRYDVMVQRAEREGTEAPSPRFAFNRFAVQLEENEQLAQFKENTKLTWREDVEFVRKVCNLIEQSELYKDYLENAEDSYEADREMWRKLYKMFVENNEELDLLLEEKSIYWNDDKEIVDSFVVKTIKRFDPQNKSQQELLPEYKDESDKDFALRLFRDTLVNAEEYQELMNRNARNWSLNRMPFIDIVILQIAISEMVTFPEIPLSVTINEYIDMAKAYSTPRSSGFINGMLDNIARTLVREGRMLKRLQ